MTNYDQFLSSAAVQMKESAIRRMGTVSAASRDIISFAPGYPAPDTFPWIEFSQIAAELLNSKEPGVLQYGPTRGYRPLLEAIGGIMSHRGISCATEELLVTTGSQQGLDLVARVLLDPGDVVLVERPSYTGALTAFRNVQGRIVGVPQEADGVDLAALDATCERLQRDGQRVKMLYVVPNFQNPTGLLIGLAKRQRLLEWAGHRDVLVVEDDPYRELYFEDSATEAHVRPIKADDREGRVIYLSSFSKTLAPGYRVAWIAAPPRSPPSSRWPNRRRIYCTGSLDQRIVYEACRRGVLDRQLPLLRSHYQHKRNVMEQALTNELGEHRQLAGAEGRLLPVGPRCRGSRRNAMIPRAVEHGVIYVAGDAFFVDHRAANTMRLSFSAPTPERIEAGVSRLALVLRAELEASMRPKAAGTSRS